MIVEGRAFISYPKYEPEIPTVGTLPPGWEEIGFVHDLGWEPLEVGAPGLKLYSPPKGLAAVKFDISVATDDIQRLCLVWFVHDGEE